MKKAILIFILLLIAAGVVLYFGWVNVKPGFFAIAHSTLTGTVEYPLESGKIHWFWQKLIPKSFHLYMIERKPIVHSFTSSHSLPGSEQLAEFGTFDLVMQIDIQYSIEYDAALKLIESGLYGEFEEHFARTLSSKVDEAAAGFVLENLTAYAQFEEEISYSMLGRLETSIDLSIRNAVIDYKLADASWSITYVEIPQIELYNDALMRYFAHLEKVFRFKEEELDRESKLLAIMNEYDLEIERWEKYGELIQKYPELLKFFYIEKFSEQADVLILPQNESTGFPKMLEPWEFLSRTPPKTMETPSPSTMEEETTVPQDQDEAASSPLEPVEGDEQAPKESEAGALTEQEAAWYEKLMFWKNIGKGDGE
jgi:hypothetical protein